MSPWLSTPRPGWLGGSGEEKSGCCEYHNLRSVAFQVKVESEEIHPRSSGDPGEERE